MRRLKKSMLCILFMAAALALDSKKADAADNKLLEIQYRKIEYDTYNDIYRYYIQYDKSYITVSVPNGCITNDEVVINSDGKSKGELYKDGDKIDYDFGNRISEPGKYFYKIDDTKSGEKRYSFEIAKKRMGGLKEYKLPIGFKLKNVVCDDKDQKIEDEANSYRFEKDGEYYVTYVSEAIKKEYTLHVVIDNEPPKLKLYGVKDGKANTSIDISDAEADVDMKVWLNGKEYVVGVKKLLKEQGKYHIELTDGAGNISRYDFEIMFYLDRYSISVIVVAIGGIIFLIFYLRRTRKNLRVR